MLLSRATLPPRAQVSIGDARISSVAVLVTLFVTPGARPSARKRGKYSPFGGCDGRCVVPSLYGAGEEAIRREAGSMLTDRREIVARLAWSLCLACVSLASFAPLLAFLNDRTLVVFFRERDLGVVMVLVISFSVVGALVVSHRPENLVGWIFCAAALFQALSLVGVEYATYARVTRPGSLPFGASVSWLAEWIWAPGLVLILVFLPLLFPDGRPPSRRWWPVAWLGGLS